MVNSWPPFLGGLKKADVLGRLKHKSVPTRNRHCRASIVDGIGVTPVAINFTSYQYHFFYETLGQTSIQN
jgi:hypothetical protein